MDADGRFTSWATELEEIPEPFRGALLERLSPRDSIHLLAFKPSRMSQGVRSPGTLLILTDRRWLVVSDDKDARAGVVECAFDDTLLVELTEFLVYGQLKIDFVAEGTAQACVIEFNTVTDNLYRQAIRDIMRRIEGGMAAARSDRAAAFPVLDMKPIVFRNAVPEALAEGRPPVAAVQWPAVYGSYGRVLAPAAALLTTDRELVLITEKRVRIRPPRQTKYGYIATFFPLVRLVGFGFRRNERFIILDLEMDASHGGETLQILFPPQLEQEVAQVLKCARRQSAESFSNRSAS